MNDVQLALLAAKLLISHKRDWLQEDYARDQAGHACDPQLAGACSWCAVGALEAVMPPGETPHKPLHYLQRVARERYATSPFSVNDRFGHRFVMKMYDEAIALAA